MTHVQAGSAGPGAVIANWLISKCCVMSQLSLANQKALDGKQPKRTARVPLHHMQASVNALNGRTVSSYRPLEAVVNVRTV
jgi:hypothetical protein